MPRRPSSSKATSPLRRFLPAQDGGVAVTVAIVTPVLIGMAALALDLGRAWSLQTELQSAADAAALAGATQLDNKADAIERATAAATGALVNNDQTFATDGSGSLAAIDGTGIRFLEAPDGPETTSDADAEFIEVSVVPRGLTFFLAPVVGALSEVTAGAQAMAGMGQAICRATPMFICGPNTGAGEPPLERGQGIWLSGGENNPGPGNFGFLAMPGQTFGANELRQVLGSDSLSQCFGAGDSMVTETGMNANVAQGFNSRFDWYSGPINQNDPNFPPSYNPVRGLKNDTTNSSRWERPDVNYYRGPGHDLSTIPIDAMGYPRDNCAYDGSCVPSEGGSPFGDGNWDIDTYMAVNHTPFGRSFDPATEAEDPANPTRFEVFKWEIENDYLPQASFPGFGTATKPADPMEENSRRVLTVAVIDCEAAGISGRTEVSPEEWYHIFATGPMAPSGDEKKAEHPDFANPSELYGEIIGPVDAGNAPEFPSTVNRRILELVR